MRRTISLFSAKLICVEFYPRTSPITIAGDRTVRWAKSRHAAKQGPSLGEHAQRSPPNLCSVGYTTFTALLHDEFLRPTGAFVHSQTVNVAEQQVCRVVATFVATWGGIGRALYSWRAGQKGY
jgi:hypothetical protein